MSLKNRVAIGIALTMFCALASARAGAAHAQSPSMHRVAPAARTQHLYVFTLGEDGFGGITTYPIRDGKFSPTSDGEVGNPPSDTVLEGPFAFGPSNDLFTVSCVLSNGCAVSPALIVYPPPYAAVSTTIPLPSSAFGMNTFQGLTVDSRGYVYVQTYPTGNTNNSSVYVYQPLVQDRGCSRRSRSAR